MPRTGLAARSTGHCARCSSPLLPELQEHGPRREQKGSSWELWGAWWPGTLTAWATLFSPSMPLFFSPTWQLSNRPRLPDTPVDSEGPWARPKSAVTAAQWQCPLWAPNRPEPQTSAKNKLGTPHPAQERGLGEVWEEGNQAGSVVGIVIDPLHGGDILSVQPPGMSLLPCRGVGRGGNHWVI